MAPAPFRISHLPWIKVSHSRLYLFNGGGLSIPDKLRLCCLLPFFLFLSLFCFFCLLWHLLLLQSLGNPGIPLTVCPKLGIGVKNTRAQSNYFRVFYAWLKQKRRASTHTVHPQHNNTAGVLVHGAHLTMTSLGGGWLIGPSTPPSPTQAEDYY